MCFTFSCEEQREPQTSQVFSCSICKAAFQKSYFAAVLMPITAPLTAAFPFFFFPLLLISLGSHRLTQRFIILLLQITSLGVGLFGKQGHMFFNKLSITLFCCAERALRLARASLTLPEPGCTWLLLVKHFESWLGCTVGGPNSSESEH